MKKGQETSSLNFLIGLILAFIMLGGVGCFAYNWYMASQYSKKYFNDFAEFLQDLEDSGEDKTGAFTYGLDEAYFVVGHPKEFDGSIFNRRPPYFLELP